MKSLLANDLDSSADFYAFKVETCQKCRNLGDQEKMVQLVCCIWKVLLLNHFHRPNCKLKMQGKPLVTSHELILIILENGFVIQNILIFIDGMTKLLTDHISTVKFFSHLCRAVELLRYPFRN